MDTKMIQSQNTCTTVRNECLALYRIPVIEYKTNVLLLGTNV